MAFCAHILGVSFFVSKFLLLRSTQVSFNCCCSVAELCPALRPHGLQDARLPCPSPSPGACSDSRPLSRWCHPTTSPSPAPFSFAFNLGLWPTLKWLGFCGGSDGKEFTCNAGDPPTQVWSLGPGEGSENPLHYSSLENSMDRGAWQAAVHGVIGLDTTKQ